MGLNDWKFIEYCPPVNPTHGIKCGQWFEKQYDLTKHKNTLGHKKPRTK